MSKMEFQGALEVEKLTKQKWKQYCGTPSSTGSQYLVLFIYEWLVFQSLLQDQVKCCENFLSIYAVFHSIYTLVEAKE